MYITEEKLTSRIASLQNAKNDLKLSGEESIYVNLLHSIFEVALKPCKTVPRLRSFCNF
jgi:hypothetical protein